MKLGASLHQLSKVTIVLALVVFSYDFSQRVWVEGTSGERLAPEFDATQYQVPTVKQDSVVSDWLTAQRQAQVTAQTEAPETPKTPLIEGGVNLGEMRVRVRGIYRSVQSSEHIALLDAQRLTDRSLELTEVSQDDVLENYEVTKINVDSVTFTGADGSTVVIPVFDY